MTFGLKLPQFGHDILMQTDHGLFVILGRGSTHVEERLGGV